jgi:hypothetical protein
MQLKAQLAAKYSPPRLKRRYINSTLRRKNPMQAYKKNYGISLNQKKTLRPWYTQEEEKCRWTEDYNYSVTGLSQDNPWWNGHENYKTVVNSGREGELEGFWDTPVGGEHRSKILRAVDVLERKGWPVCQTMHHHGSST